MNGIEQQGGKPAFPSFGIFLIGFLAVIMLPLIILVMLQSPTSRQQEAVAFVQIPQKQNNEQEIIVSADKATLYVPEDATDLTGNFVISPRKPDLYSFASEAEWSRPIVVDIEYRNAEGVNYPGITFSKPVSICFTLTLEQWEDFSQRPDDFQVQHYDEKQSPSRWVSLPRTKDPDGYELCGQTDHFSIYALAIKPAAVIPVTGPTLTPTASPPPTPTVFNTQESRRDQNSDDEPATPIPANTVTQPPQATNTSQPVNTPTTQPTTIPPTQPPTVVPPTVVPPTETPEPPIDVPTIVINDTPILEVPTIDLPIIEPPTE
jgi:hypothetical protein